PFCPEQDALRGAGVHGRDRLREHDNGSVARITADAFAAQLIQRLREGLVDVAGFDDFHLVSPSVGSAGAARGWALRQSYFERILPSPRRTRSYLSNSHKECSMSRISKRGLTSQGSPKVALNPGSSRSFSSIMSFSISALVCSGRGFALRSRPYRRFRPRIAPGPALAHV